MLETQGLKEQRAALAQSRYPIPAASLHKPHQSELVIRRSRFLARSARASSREEARAFVERIASLDPSATHHCWAFVAGPPGDSARIGSSDAGEPHGTAGRPMLQILLHSGLGEICLVVSRWFGGVKLGSGGLVRAYQDSARENLAALPQRLLVPQSRVSLVLPYAGLESLKRGLSGLEAEILEESYAESVGLALSLPTEHLEKLAQLAASSKATLLEEASGPSLA